MKNSHRVQIQLVFMKFYNNTQNMYFVQTDKIHELNIFKYLSVEGSGE